MSLERELFARTVPARLDRERLHLSAVGDRCEWDPERNVPADYIPVGAGMVDYLGCPNDATLVVGADGKWRLCAECAALPRFKRFRKRVPIKERS